METTEKKDMPTLAEMPYPIQKAVVDFHDNIVALQHAGFNQKAVECMTRMFGIIAGFSSAAAEIKNQDISEETLQAIIGSVFNQ